MKFQNPHNGYQLNSSSPFSWLWCLMFGPLYFLCRGNLVHMFLSFALALLSHGFSFLFYPIFVYEVNKNHFLRKGWIQVD